MKRIRSRSFAASSLLALALAVQALLPVLRLGDATDARAAARPRYGGTLRLEMQSPLTTLDPSDPAASPMDASARSALAILVYDRLVQFDDAGNIVAGLATSWRSDAREQEWQFRLRPGVRFHDGRALTPSAVANSLTDYAQKRGGIWRASTFGETVVIRAESPLPQLPYELAGAACSIYRQSPDGKHIGTGPFRIADWDPGRSLRLVANDDYWAGRPYLDAIEVHLGRPLREQGIALGLGQADVVQLSPDQLRNSPNGTRTWSSLPVQLINLAVTQPALLDPRLRQALSLSIDRAAIRDVLLNRNGETAFGVLPAWLSGYAFAFEKPRDLEYARQLVQQISPRDATLTLSYDSRDPLAKAIAERIAVNAGEVGIKVQTVAREQLRLEGVDLVLLRISIPSFAFTTETSFGDISNRDEWLHPFASNLQPQKFFEAEKRWTESLAIPIVHIPVSYGLGPRVRNWAPAKWAEWRLADVWLEESPAAPAEEKP